MIMMDLETTEMQKTLEDMATESLLIEMFNNKQAEVFENVVFEGKKRYYVEDLTQRDYVLENTTPYQLKFLDLVFNEHVWGNLLSKVSNALLNLFPDYESKIFDFRCPWSKQVIFCTEERTNFKPVRDGMFINVNHTALHSCWLLQDLFDFFNIDKSTVIFLINRPSGAEPVRVKEYVSKRFKRNFASFIVQRYEKSQEYAENNVIQSFEKYLNPMLRNVSKSYVNFFLFDDNTVLSTYVKKVRTQISLSMVFDDSSKKILNKYLDYLVSFYKESK